MKRLFGLLAVVGTLMATPVFAHHSFSAEYDIQAPVTITGTVTRLDWVNPHGWIYIDVKDDSGKVTNWAIEFGSPSQLLRRGVRKTDFPIGIAIVVKGYKSRNGAPRINGTSVKTPEGKNFFTGSPDGPEGGGEQ
jgi:DNA/RNA endonuclease YhcR with UshA esterase domain